MSLNTRSNNFPPLDVIVTQFIHDSLLVNNKRGDNIPNDMIGPSKKQSKLAIIILKYVKYMYLLPQYCLFIELNEIYRSRCFYLPAATVVLELECAKKDPLGLTNVPSFCGSSQLVSATTLLLSMMIILYCCNHFHSTLFNARVNLILCRTLNRPKSIIALGRIPDMGIYRAAGSQKHATWIWVPNY